MSWYAPRVPAGLLNRFGGRFRQVPTTSCGKPGASTVVRRRIGLFAGEPGPNVGCDLESDSRTGSNSEASMAAIKPLKRAPMVRKRKTAQDVPVLRNCKAARHRRARGRYQACPDYRQTLLIVIEHVDCYQVARQACTNRYLARQEPAKRKRQRKRIATFASNSR
jgi:hypothetical protein